MKSRIVSVLLVTLLATACSSVIDIGIEHSPNDATSPAVPTNTQVAINIPLPTFTPAGPASLPAANGVPAVIATTAPTLAADPAGASYIDDRSTPSQVIVSFYNAINRQEYLRAYNYWINPSTSAGSYSAFANGYKDTASVELVFGQITQGAGAGQIYFTIPVILKTTATNGTHTNYAACYLVHEAQQANFTAPPIQPMGIDRGEAKVSNLNASDTTVLATACNDYPTGPSPVATSAGSLAIDKTNFLDNRSGPVETVSSLLNALNLRQYVRAYSYFQDPAKFPGPFSAYMEGYSATEEITASFGVVQSDGAAGNLYFKLPLAMHVLTTSGATQTFVGCYTLHLAQPAVQATPPFQPMGITAGNFSQVDNGTDGNTLLPAACN